MKTASAVVSALFSILNSKIFNDVITSILRHASQHLDGQQAAMTFDWRASTCRTCIGGDPREFQKRFVPSPALSSIQEILGCRCYTTHCFPTNTHVAADQTVCKAKCIFWQSANQHCAKRVSSLSSLSTVALTRFSPPFVAIVTLFVSRYIRHFFFWKSTDSILSTT